MIIEVKCTGIYIELPVGGWYNLQCQLWAYSWIDKFQDANNIYIQADIKLREKVLKKRKKGWRFSQRNSCPLWHIKKNGKLNLEDEEVRIFHEQYKDMFEYYGGEFIE